MADQIIPLRFERPKLTLLVREAAAELGVSLPQLEQLIKAGRVRCLNLQPGADRRISYAELVRFVEVREQTGVEGHPAR